MSVAEGRVRAIPGRELTPHVVQLFSPNYGRCPMLKQAIFVCVAILSFAFAANGAVVTYVLQTPGVV